MDAATNFGELLETDIEEDELKFLLGMPLTNEE